MATSGHGLSWFRIQGSQTLFTSGYAIASNPRVAPVVVDNILTLSNENIPNTQILDIVSSSYYDSTYTNFTATIKSYDL
jgi:hypothetical protein